MSFPKTAAMFAVCSCLMVIGCGSGEVKDDLNLKGPAPKVLTPDPGMKAPEDRGGGKGGPAEGQG